MTASISGTVPSSAENKLFPQTSAADVARKLSTIEIFDKIRPLLCLINSAEGESSGFIIDGKGTLLTVAHNIGWINRGGNFEFETTFVQVDHVQLKKPDFPIPSDGIIDEHARELDLYSMKSKIQLSESDILPILPPEIPLKEGMKVYFAGYPLGQERIIFHKGILSSISEDKGIRRFTIDGTIVPGNSGGPVVVQYQGKIYLIGVITSEIADFSPEDRKIIAIMKALSEERSKKGLPPSGMTTTVQIRTIEGTETVRINDKQITALIFDLIQRNLSTGIGKAIDIRCYLRLFKKEPKLSEISKYSFPVAGKGKKLITGVISSEETVIAKYTEVRYGKTGKGNRGIRILIQSDAEPKAYCFKFTPNPHTAPGNYNKNQKELYNHAAMKLVETLIVKKSLPKSVVFDACKHEYTAILDEDSG